MKNTKPEAVGIIAEYNPFHKGHGWQLKKARELSGAGYCIVAISGDFVQRGAPAIYDKYVRTAMALEAGVDLVVELPSVFAVSSAWDFASCGIALLDRLGVVTSVCFGCESGDIKPIARAADLLNSEPEAYTSILKERLKQGSSFPIARAQALSSLEDFEEGFLSSPNNILAIEYVRAILKSGSSIKPIALLRRGSGYHDTSISEDFCSASAIRKAIEGAGGGRAPSPLSGKVPGFVQRAIERGYPVCSDDFSTLLNAALLKFSASPLPPSGYLDLTPELAARIRRQCLQFTSFDQRVAALKTRQYTYTRVSRALLHIVLDISSQEAVNARRAGYAPYIRVLGFRRRALPLLSEIKKRGLSPLITKTADASRLLNETAREMLEKDILRSHLYQAVVSGKYHIELKNEYTRSVIIKE